MYGTIVSTTLLGLSAFAAARPTSWHVSNGTNATSTSSSGSATVSAFKFPLSNGFPAISKGSSQLSTVEEQAGGTLPNGTPPPSVSGDTQVSLGFIAFNELFEVAFFTELIQNITEAKPGYDQIDDSDGVLGILKEVLAQEELHELNANFAFNAFTGKTIEPCQYDFPVDNLNDAIALASTFTDVVLSTLPDIQTLFAGDVDSVGLIRGVGSVIGQEGEQNGFYRQILHKNPSQLPFLTAGARDFAFNAILQSFVVPDSCPSLGLLEQPQEGTGLTELFVLNVLTPAQVFGLEDITAKFSIQTIKPAHSVQAQVESYQSYADGGLFMTYINQQNVPVSVPIDVSGISGDALEFTASFPGQSQDLNGLTIAVVTSTNQGLTSTDVVAEKTLFGPGLIEIN